jgi:Fe-S cluster biosynthesis and repair protein YggX
MFLLESPPPENPDPLFFLSLGMGSAIYFCVWLLEQDGLRVPPFDQHPDGDGSLRSSGLTAETWRTWMTRTALLIDQRRLWRSDLFAMETQEEQLFAFEQDQQAISAVYPDLELPPFDAPALTEQLDRHTVWQDEQFEKIQAALRSVYGETTPPDVFAGDEELAAWQGVPAVTERLHELRSEYPFAERERSWVTYQVDRETGNPSIEEMAIDTERLPELVRSHWERLGVLELHLIAYPYLIEYAIAPNAIVLSLSPDPVAFRRLIAIDELSPTIKLTQM